MNILVFGKDGQLGKAFKVVFDASKAGEIHHIEYVGRAKCDLSNSDAIAELLNRVKPDLLINAAAYTAVDKAETEVDLAYAINAKAPEIMAQYAVANGASLLHYSTDYVFDGSKKTPYIESDVRNPLGIYGKSKAAGEEAIEAVFKTNHHSNAEISDLAVKAQYAQYAILRTSWVYGDGGNFIRTILRLAKERETLKVIADQYGVPTSATWLAEVSLALVLNEQHQLKPFPSGIYHAVPLGETTWHALACHAVQAAFDAGAALKLLPDAIAAIPATDYPLPAPRPMNSRMKRGADAALDRALDKASGDLGDMTKSPLLAQSWESQVAAYVQDLALRKLL
ncbi:dTDP-4-dehydrorhamnose reductase [Polynucleobacter difficilis]|uniref:dTDP-4-dehydrorhamnose reductase n=1 Tax=Polynucleobacter difficilis TaxID=556054 RepID=UPI000D3CF78E|nr:dTDP-4-dehydrorhamnose reductase [Polynucleobacter difficilis]